MGFVKRKSLLQRVMHKCFGFGEQVRVVYMAGFKAVHVKAKTLQKCVQLGVGFWVEGFG
jgi:hypothetical protein